MSVETPYLVQTTTIFFRDLAAIKTVEKLAPQFGPNVRIASVGCSTGEEVYSLLFSHVLAPKDYGLEIDGYDYNPEVLKIASAGTYTFDAKIKKNPYSQSGRNLMFGLNSRSTGIVEVTIPQYLKEGVRFIQHDISKEPLPDEYPLISCNNVLYHYADHRDRPSVGKLLDNLAKSLQPGGFLVIESEPTFMDPGQEKYSYYLTQHEDLTPRYELASRFHDQVTDKIHTARVFQKT